MKKAYYISKNMLVRIKKVLVKVSNLVNFYNFIVKNQ